MHASEERVRNPVTGVVAGLEELEVAADADPPLHRILFRYAMVLYLPVITLLIHLSVPLDGIVFPILNVVAIVVLSWGAHGSWRYTAPFRGWQAGLLAVGAASMVSIAVAVLVGQHAGAACSLLAIGAVVGAGVAQWWAAVRPCPREARGRTGRSALGG